MSQECLRHAQVTHGIIGAFYDVYNDLGPGFLESVYERAMKIALEERGLRVNRQCPIEVRYRGYPVGHFRADLVVEATVLVELKASDRIHPRHVAQVINALKATRFEVGLLLNFGPKAERKRIILTNDQKTRSGQIRADPC